MAPIPFCLCLQHPGLLPLAVCYDKFMENLIRLLFHLLTDKIKISILWANFSVHKSLFGTGYGRIGFFTISHYFSWNNYFNFFFLGGGGGKNTLHYYFPSIFDFLIIFGIPSGSLLSSFSEAILGLFPLEYWC